MRHRSSWGAHPGARERPHHRRRFGPAALLAALALALAACGGGHGRTTGVASLSSTARSSASTTAGGGQDELRLAIDFARCMRRQGIDMPDPQRIGGNIVERTPNRHTETFKAAERACRQYEPNGGQPVRPSAEEFQRALSAARCMRQHGIDVPDPRMTADGIDQPLPNRVSRDNPRLEAAERACGVSLPSDKLTPRGG